MQQYMRENDLVTVENKLAIYPQKLTEFSSQLSKAQADQKGIGGCLQPDRSGWFRIYINWRIFRSLPKMQC